MAFRIIIKARAASGMHRSGLHLHKGGSSCYEITRVSNPERTLTDLRTKSLGNDFLEL